MAEFSLRHLFLGKPIPTSEASHERLTNLKALAVFASDALSSTAYATEEILRLLVTAGTGALSISIPLAVAIIALLGIVGLSYYQTIHAYPMGGGTYVVTKDNLGSWARQLQQWGFVDVPEQYLKMP